MKNKIMKILGWILIGYGILPFIIFVGVILFTSPEPLSPISPTSPEFLKAASVPELLILLYQISVIIFSLMSFFIPVGSFIAGIALLRLKKWARKFALWVFSIIVGTKLISFSVALSHPYLRTLTYSNKARNFGFGLFFLFEIVIIWLLIYKIKPITNQSSGREPPLD